MLEETKETAARNMSAQADTSNISTSTSTPVSPPAGTTRRFCAENSALSNGGPAKKQKISQTPVELDDVDDDDNVNAVVLTFSMDQYPAYFQLLPHHTLRDLVCIAFSVCDPRSNGDDDNSHMWEIRVNNDKKRYSSEQMHSMLMAEFGATQTPCLTKLDEALPRDKISGTIVKGTKLNLKYDFGSTSYHVLRLISVDEFPKNDSSVNLSDFPRRRPEPVIAHDKFITAAGDNLKESFPNLQKYAFGGKRQGELNFFKAGRKNVHGFLEQAGRMVFLPEKASSWSHYLTMLERGTAIPRQYGRSWQSVVILPQNFKKYKQYFQDIDPGFCDCKLVAEPTNGKDWDSIFPKTAAFAGFCKDKQIKQKGWIRYSKGILQIVVGSGSPSHCHSGMKGTAFAGQDCHVPSSTDTILFRLDEKFDSIHDLFCKVEGLLRALK